MANHEVDGILLPDAVAGHPALELANTRAGWGTVQPREYLVSYDAFALWARESQLLTAQETRALRRESCKGPTQIRAARRALSEVRALRSVFYDVVTAPSRGEAMPTDQLSHLSTALRRADSVSRLVMRQDGRVLADGGDLERSGLMLPVHRAAITVGTLLADGQAQNVGACAGRGCGWLFLDAGHRRRWCVMAICGNRSKARAFAARRQD